MDSFNFSEVSALVIEPDRFSYGIIGQILRGYGLEDLVLITTGGEAKKLLPGGRFHLLLTESLLPDMAMTSLLKWIRRHPKNEVRFLPVVMLTGYAQFSRVTTARDAGVNSVVCKPVAPVTLFDHIMRAARPDRAFIDADDYAGPCRRFHDNTPDPEQSRRASDHPMEAFRLSGPGRGL